MDYAAQVAIFALLSMAALWIIISAAGALPLLKLANVDLVRLDGDAARALVAEGDPPGHRRAAMAQRQLLRAARSVSDRQAKSATRTLSFGRRPASALTSAFTS